MDSHVKAEHHPNDESHEEEDHSHSHHSDEHTHEHENEEGEEHHHHYHDTEEGEEHHHHHDEEEEVNHHHDSPNISIKLGEGSPLAANGKPRKKKHSHCHSHKKKQQPELYYVLQNLNPKTLNRNDGSNYNTQKHQSQKVNYKFPPTLDRSVHDLIPINFEERTAKEVITNSVIFDGSDDNRKFWDSLKRLKNCNHSHESQVGYQYCSSYNRPFPFLYKKVFGVKPKKKLQQKQVIKNSSILTASAGTAVNADIESGQIDFKFQSTKVSIKKEKVDTKQSVINTDYQSDYALKGVQTTAQSINQSTKKSLIDKNSYTRKTSIITQPYTRSQTRKKIRYDDIEARTEELLRDKLKNIFTNTQSKIETTDKLLSRQTPIVNKTKSQVSIGTYSQSHGDFNVNLFNVNLRNSSQVMTPGFNNYHQSSLKNFRQGNSRYSSRNHLKMNLPITNIASPKYAYSQSQVIGYDMNGFPLKKLGSTQALIMKHNLKKATARLIKDLDRDINVYIQ